MPRLHLAILTTRNETWRFWKRISKFWNSNSMFAIWSKLFILFTNKILCKLDNTKILLCKFSVRYLVVKPAFTV